MKLALLCTTSLIITVVAAAAIGYAPTQAKWGDSGVRSMFAVASICLAAAIIAVIPIFIVAPRWPAQVGPAVFAGLALRLLLTIGALAAYQILAAPQLASFLVWAVIFYLLVLAIDTGFGVAAVRRFYPKTPQLEGKPT